MTDACLATFVWGAPQWLLPAAVIGVLALVALTYCYLGGYLSWQWTSLAGLLKLTAFVLLLLCLLEPLYRGNRARPGANTFLVLADNSRSLQIRDPGNQLTRGEELKEQLQEDDHWTARLNQDFDTRWYAFDSRLETIADLTELQFDGEQSAVIDALMTATGRFLGRPLAGVMVLTDGNATDLPRNLALAGLPPIYPVILGSTKDVGDLRVDEVAVSQSNFEAAPISIQATVSCQGSRPDRVAVQVIDQEGTIVQQQTVADWQEGKSQTVRFRVKPLQHGILFYTVRVVDQTELEREVFEHPERSREAVLANNQRMVMVDHGGGPYRVLYVGGRPNWEFKFLRRAVEEDPEIELVGLVRIAKREPKFDFRSREGESTNPLFRGFGNQADEQAEQYDQPVLLRLGTRDESELRDGFPIAKDLLYAYDAVILDDVEADFLTRDQMTLLHQFVSERGGGLFMLGGLDSFDDGGYQRTQVSELLPVYLHSVQQLEVDDRFQWKLSREGWLQPWVRLRETSAAESLRLDNLPALVSAHGINSIKPGATVLAHIRNSQGDELPALVTQRFGKGRVGALLVADLWRWGLRRAADQPKDLDAAWRQTVRWLVADVPQRIEVDVSLDESLPLAPANLDIVVRDPTFEPLDNARVDVEITPPDDAEPIKMTAEPASQQRGTYRLQFTPRKAGAYRATVTATAPDGTQIGTRETGWTADLDRREFSRIQANRELLDQLARDTGGQMVTLDDVDHLVRDLPNRRAPVMESWSYPLWHHWLVMIVAIACLAGEWGLRRWKGLP